MVPVGTVWTIYNLFGNPECRETDRGAYVLSNVTPFVSVSGTQGGNRLANEFGDRFPFGFGFCRIQPVPIHPVPLSLWPPAARAVEAAHSPSSHGWRLTPVFRPLRRGGALGRVLEGVFPVHGVVPVFCFCPPPPELTFPTIAWPPSFTVTCSTVIFCCPPVR